MVSRGLPWSPVVSRGLLPPRMWSPRQMVLQILLFRVLCRRGVIVVMFGCVMLWLFDFSARGSRHHRRHRRHHPLVAIGFPVFFTETTKIKSAPSGPLLQNALEEPLPAHKDQQPPFFWLQPAVDDAGTARRPRVGRRRREGNGAPYRGRAGRMHPALRCGMPRPANFAQPHHT